MNPYEPGRYVWTIKRQLRPPCNSTTSYASFDEARRFGKVEMDDLVADWRAVRDGGRAAVSRGIEAAQAGLTRSPERR